MSNGYQNLLAGMLVWCGLEDMQIDAAEAIPPLSLPVRPTYTNIVSRVSRLKLSLCQQPPPQRGNPTDYGSLLGEMLRPSCLCRRLGLATLYSHIILSFSSASQVGELLFDAVNPVEGATDRSDPLRAAAYIVVFFVQREVGCRGAGAITTQQVI